jgi:hypothetical protein
MRARFSNYYKECATDRLHGLIFFGTRFAHYHIEKDTGKWSPPLAAETGGSRINTEPPADRWLDDVLQELSAELLLELFGNILRSCRTTEDD